MKATELNGTHLGRTMTVTIDRATVRDILTGVRHEADLINCGIMNGFPDMAIGRQYVTLDFQRAGEVRADERAEVTIHEG